MKTAEEHIRDIDNLAKTLTKEVAEFRRKQALEEDYQDLRDDVISIVKNSGKTFEQIHEKFGPTPDTLRKWMEKTVQRPQLAKMQTTLRACGKDFTIIDGRRPKKSRGLQ